MTAERPMQARQPISSMRHPRRRGVNINHVMATIMICTGTMAGLVSMLLIFRPHPRASLVKACPNGSLATNVRGQPAYTLQHNFMPASEFAALHAELLERRPVMSQQQLEQGFNAENVNFNLDGAEDLLWQDSAEHPIAPLHALVERLRLPRANAWSLNVVFSQPRGIQRAGRSGPQDAHMDNLALTDSTGAHTCRLASYQTSVLYLSVPEDMAGGNLTILEAPAFARVLATITPRENLLVKFRGDAAHRVEEFNSRSMRVSVTLEQYLVPTRLYWATPTFEAKKLRY